MEKSKTTIRSDTTQRHLHKYTNKNIIHRLTLGRFFDTAAQMLRPHIDSSVLEFGCGEGLFLEELKKRDLIFSDMLGIDLRQDAISEARTLHSDYSFAVQDLLSWDDDRTFDLTIASQVLEHLYEPEIFLKELIKRSRRYLFLTVPYEPWFRLMNLLRGRDILAFGNHPEHVNWWGKSSFGHFLEPHLRILQTRVSFPFILALAERRND